MENGLLKIKTNLRLRDVEIVILDCQATHSHPTKGELFEIGWIKTRVSESQVFSCVEEKVESYLLKLPTRIKMSNAVQKITGLQNEDFSSAPLPQDIWPKLQTAVKETAAKNGLTACPTVIHYARYETPFLKFFQKKFYPHTPFPFHIICTHQIFKRLFPGLPRKGLRAAAGFFGFSIPETRRSLFHVLGTAHIWGHIVKVLEQQEGLSSFDEFLNWMDTYPSNAGPSKYIREYPMSKTFRQNLPAHPGIYRMFRSNGDLLYIGKAKSLRDRVNSYFHKRSSHSEHILNMLSQASSLTFSVTDTAVEAALRESDEIKALAPPFNIALRRTEEGTVFFTKDLKRFSQKPNKQYRIGPLPSKRYIESLSSLMDILNGKTSAYTPEVIQKTLATSDEYAPEPLLFCEGLRKFQEQHKNLLKIPVTSPILMKLGTALWKEKLSKQAEARRRTELEKDTLVLKSDPPKKKNLQQLHWTPERIAKVLSSIIRTGTYLIRRTRWFCLLTDSILVWENSDKGQNHLNCVFTRNGLPSFETSRLFSFDRPHWPKKRKSIWERQKNFDLFTYDRMRILTTEIKRILEDNRNVTLYLGPNLNLKNEQLRKVLKWV